MLHTLPLSRLSLLLLMLAAACSGESPTAITDADLAITADHPAGARQALARKFARALTDPDFRSYVQSELAASRHPEGKIHLGRFMRGQSGRAARALGAAESEVRGAEALEVYFPVPEHRNAWDGGADVMVGTIGADGEIPVGFDLRGQRRPLDPAAPPAVPVLAVVPAETDFDALEREGFSAAKACPDCGDGSGDNGGGGGGSVTPGLYIRASHLNETFESWLKGKPEIEVLVLGQKGSTDSLTSYQCAGNFGPGAYYFDQNSVDWSGTALLMNQNQLDSYNAQHPGQALRLFFLEDDDTPCEIKSNNSDLKRLLSAVDSAVKGVSGGRSEDGSLQDVYKAYQAAQKIFSVLASAIKTNDDLIGNAVEDVTTSERYPGYNWIIKADNGVTNGYVKLEMR